MKGRQLEEVIGRAIQQLQEQGDNVVIATEYKSQLISLRHLKLPANSIVRVCLAFVPNALSPVYNVRFSGPDPIDVGPLLSWLDTMKDPGDITDVRYPKFP